METRDLQTFLAVAASGSITKAAEMLGRSQPSVTRTIQDLEAELGFELLHRAGRRVQLSEEGVAFEEEARRLLMSFTELATRDCRRQGADPANRYYRCNRQRSSPGRYGRAEGRGAAA